MTKKHAVAGTVLLMLITPVASVAATDEYGERGKDAPVELEQFGRLAGKWQCEVTSVRPGGEQVKSEAVWTWRWINNGTAIIDEWYNQGANGNTFFGTNVRTYNSDAEKWTIRWFTPYKQSEIDTYFAHAEGEAVIMTRDFVGRDGKNYSAKITFYNITEDSFDWKQQISADGGKAWGDPNMIIKCTRVNQACCRTVHNSGSESLLCTSCFCPAGHCNMLGFRVVQTFLPDGAQKCL